MPRFGFEPASTMLERSRNIRAVNSAATGTGVNVFHVQGVPIHGSAVLVAFITQSLAWGISSRCRGTDSVKRFIYFLTHQLRFHLTAVSNLVCNALV
jgi:hypothetical protein